MSQVVELDAHRPHGVYRERCNVCGHVVIGVVPIGADLSRLECSLCGALDSQAELVQLDEDGNALDSPLE